MSKTIEKRNIAAQDFSIRAVDNGSDYMQFSGYAAVFDSPSEPLPFIETIAPGAFGRSLRSRNEVKMFVNHNMDQVLASKRSGTLRLVEDSKGLFVEADLPPTTYARDLSVLMQRGDVTSMSFGFSVPSGGDSWVDGSNRRLNEVRLHEVSIVTGFPAYEATTAQVRSIELLATRTNLDADALAAALTLLENGQELADDQASLISEAVERLRPARVDDEPIGTSGSKLDILAKQLDLTLKSV
jgi:HK97 family phage prohead protease